MGPQTAAGGSQQSAPSRSRRADRESVQDQAHRAAVWAKDQTVRHPHANLAPEDAPVELRHEIEGRGGHPDLLIACGKEGRLSRQHTGLTA